VAHGLADGEPVDEILWRLSAVLSQSCPNLLNRGLDQFAESILFAFGPDVSLDIVAADQVIPPTVAHIFLVTVDQASDNAPLLAMDFEQLGKLIVLFFGPYAPASEAVEPLSAPVNQFLPPAGGAGSLNRCPKLTIGRPSTCLRVFVDQLIKLLLRHTLAFTKPLDRPKNLVLLNR
jgi:hypothetical protein